MKFLIILLTLTLAQVARADLKTTLGLKGGERICFGGDSITHAQMYSSYLMAWLQLTYPELDLETYTIAQSGTSLPAWYGGTPPISAPATSLYEEYIYPFEPDIVCLMHGHNGGQNAADHGATYSKLWTDWIDGQSGAKLIMLGMHPTQLATDNKDAKGKADAEAALGATSPRIFSSHTFNLMGARWLANSNNAIDVQQLGAEPFTTSGVTSNDGAALVHPGPAGHIAIAWASLKGLGAETVVSRATLDAATNVATSATNCSISSMALTPHGGTFKRLDSRLPWAIDEAGRANAVALYPEIAGWQDYSMKVTGLVAGNYTIKCDGIAIGSATAEQLAGGRNMADLTLGPVWAQCQDVLNKIRELEGYNPTNGDSMAGNANTGTIGDIFDYRTVFYINGGQRGATYKASMAPMIAALSPKMKAVQSAAQPVDRTYTIEPQKAWSYAGVPYPDWEYDPFSYPVPKAPSEWPSAAHVGYYYVAPDEPSATDTVASGEAIDKRGMRYGYPGKPRATLPVIGNNSAAYDAGVVVWISGGVYDTPFNGKTKLHGTAVNPTWVYGDPNRRPSFRKGYFQIVDSQYFFVENIDWVAGADLNGALTFQSNSTEGNTHHGAIRNCRFMDRDYISGGGAMVGVIGSSAVSEGELYDMVFYKLTFKNCGGGYDWSVGDNDHHGFKVDTQQAHKIWIVECEAVPGDAPDPVDGLFKSISGNMIQVGQDHGMTEPSNIYIAGNKMSRTRQAGIGIKHCKKVIISGNKISDVNRTAAAGININFSLRPNIWVIGNEVSNCAGGVHLGSESVVGNSTYVIGNLIHDNHHGDMNSGWRYMSGVSIWDMRGKHYVVNNTFDNQAYGVYFAPRPTSQDADSELHIYNNIFSRSGSEVDPDTADIRISNWATGFHLYIENNLFDALNVYLAGTGEITSLGFLNGRTDSDGNLKGGPLFVNAGAGNYSSKAGSPAIDAGTQKYTTNGSPDVYQLFIDAFSDDPDFPGKPADVWPRDWKNGPRVRGSSIDIGAYETAEDEPKSPPTTPTPPTPPRGLEIRETQAGAPK